MCKQLRKKGTASEREESVLKLKDEATYEITFDLQTHVLLLFQTTRETLIKTKVKSVALVHINIVAKKLKQKLATK